MRPRFPRRARLFDFPPADPSPPPPPPPAEALASARSAADVLSFLDASSAASPAALPDPALVAAFHRLARVAARKDLPALRADPRVQALG